MDETVTGTPEGEAAPPEQQTQPAQQRPSVIDVAEYILERHAANARAAGYRGDMHEKMSTMKLQRLVYFAQGWNLAFVGTPLFDEKIEAWASGPVVRELWELHKDELMIGPGFFRNAVLQRRAGAPDQA